LHPILACREREREREGLRGITAIDLFFDMVLSGNVLDRFTLSEILSACAELKLLSLGQQLHSWVIYVGFALDVCIGCCLVDMYAKCLSNGSSVDTQRERERERERGGLIRGIMGSLGLKNHVYGT